MGQLAEERQHSPSQRATQRHLNAVSDCVDGFRESAARADILDLMDEDDDIQAFMEGTCARMSVRHF